MENVTYAQIDKTELDRILSDEFVEGVHFGRFLKQGADPASNHPDSYSVSLLKGGAALIAAKLHLTAEFTPANYIGEAQHQGMTHPLFVECECRLRNKDNQIVSIGAGARNLNYDGNNLNSSIKMARKSAFVDAVLWLTNLSDQYTQDIEDINHVQNSASATPIDTSPEAMKKRQELLERLNTAFRADPSQEELIKTRYDVGNILDLTDEVLETIVNNLIKE